MVTKTVSDEFEFKVPTLRDIEQTPLYFYIRKVWNLNQAAGIMGLFRLGIELEDDDIDKITAFSLTPTRNQSKVEYLILQPNTDTILRGN